MRIECPHCKNKLNLVDVESADSGGSSACPSCGSVIDALEQTVTQKHDYADTVGHFSLIGQVGVGQFGTVWRARDTVLKRTVAVKIPRESELDGSQRDMFLRVAQAAAKLTHEGIVRTLEVGEDESGRIFIVSDFVNGITLAEKMKQSGPSWLLAISQRPMNSTPHRLLPPVTCPMPTMLDWPERM